MELGSSQDCTTRRWEIMGVNRKREVQVGYKEKICSWGQPGSGPGCSKRMCHPPVWRFSKPNWTKPWATRSELRAGPALSRRLDLRPPEVPSNVNFPIPMINPQAVSAQLTSTVAMLIYIHWRSDLESVVNFPRINNTTGMYFAWIIKWYENIMEGPFMVYL